MGEYLHELVMPNEDLPFKLFLFEGKDGNYVREKHWHRSVEIFAVFEGRLDFLLGTEELPLSAGEFVIVNSNEVHSIHAPEANRTVVLQIPFRAFENYYTEEQFIHFTREEHRCDGQFLEHLRQMYEIYEEKEPGYELRVQSHYYMLMYLLVTVYRKREVSPELVRSRRNLSKLSAITDYIKNNYQKELSLEGLAQIFGYSPSYLSRMFQKYAQINYKTYLQSVRLEHAGQELLHTDKELSQVAEQCGFADGRAFAKAFRKKYGVLPSEYRRAARKSARNRGQDREPM